MSQVQWIANPPLKNKDSCPGGHLRIGIFLPSAFIFSTTLRSTSIVIQSPLINDGAKATMTGASCTILPMRKEDLDRRSDELKARMLAERDPGAQKNLSSASTKESASRAKPSERVAKVRGETSSTERAEVSALKKRIAQLVAENEILRRQLASTNYPAPSPSRSNDDSVREQQHNFFKYSNLRRY